MFGLTAGPSRLTFYLTRVGILGTNPNTLEKEMQMMHVFEDRAPTLQEAQRIVGGLVEFVRSPENPEWQVLVNEEGLLNGLPLNEEATSLCKTKIVGPAIVLKGDARWD